MAVTDGGIGAHHVEVLLAVLVPDIDTAAALQNDGQWMIVVSAILRFEVHTRTHIVTSYVLRALSEAARIP